jgi:23S rRNA pseudouridine1911/1915/1917 synthase
MERKITIKVPPSSQGQRLDIFLAHNFDHTRSFFQKLAKSGHILVNGLTAKSSYLVGIGDQVRWDVPVSQAQPKFMVPQVQIVYKDPFMAVIDKPAGLLTHPAGPDSREPSVVDSIRALVTDSDPERPGIVHRLDRNTSGLLIIARTVEAKHYFQQLFRDHLVQKTYIALVKGRPNPPSAVIKLPLGRTPTNPLKRAVKSQGRQAITCYDTVANFSGFSLLQITPQTGRTHQIRAHLAHIGHPIAGDSVYGDQRPLLKRQFLHATKLEFTGPDGRHHDFTSPLPTDLQSVLDQLTSAEIR